MTLYTEPASGRRYAFFAASAVGIVLALAAVYGIAGFTRNPAGAVQCRSTGDIVNRVAPLARGEVAAVSLASSPAPVPDLRFQDAAGQTRSLSDWRGRTVLLNLWATWCVPCRKEMPALEALQAKFGGAEFEVVAVNIDTRDPEKPKAWLKEVGIDGLGYYSDPSAKVFQDLKAVGKAFGMPTTFLIDPAGCEIGTLAGPAEWGSGDAQKLVQAILRE